MLVQILTPQEKIFDAEAESIILPGVNGEFQILANHVAIVSTLVKGIIKIAVANQKEKIEFEINQGIIEFSNNKAIILSS